MEDREIIEHVGNRKVIVLLNKQDKGSVVTAEDVKNLIPQAIVLESALLEGKGVEDLADAVENMVYGGEVSQSENLMVTNVRHKNLLDEGEKCMIDALEMVEFRQPLEFIEIDVNRCYEALGEIIGESYNEELLDELFNKFCVGK